MSEHLNQKKRDYYKERLAHYLKSYRERHDLNQADVAKKLGYAIDHYKRLELAGEERIANVMEFFTNFALLDFSNALDFLVYLENTTTPGSSRELYPWEKNLLKGFNELPSEIRRDFTASFCAEKKKSTWDLGEAIELLRSISRLDKQERLLVEVMISRLTKQGLTTEELLQQ